MKRIKILVTLVVLAIAVLSGAIGNQNRTLAADYSCHTSSCTGVAQCSGDRYAQTGKCAITCYREAGNPAGLIIVNGSANCAPPSTGGGGGGTGGGGGGGGGGGEFGGGYCYDNWLWDSNCGGDPWNPFEPEPIIN